MLETSQGTMPGPRVDDIEDEFVLNAVGLLKMLEDANRFRIVCVVAQQERTVNEIGRLIGLNQSSVSQHLSRLRLGGWVQTRREAHKIHYSIKDTRVIRLLSVISNLRLARSPIKI